MFKLIKHRGIYNNDIKENSYEGIKLALEDNNYIGVEFDIRETLDNEIILFHNPIYNNKLINKTKYSELPKYVPKLEDILNIISNKLFLIEIKNIEHNFDKFIKLLNKHKDKNIYVMSFYTNNIKRIDIENRFYKIGILNYILNTNNYIKKLDFVGILNNLINKEVINNLKNIQIFSYGINKNKKYDNIYYIVDKL